MNQFQLETNIERFQLQKGGQPLPPLIYSTGKSQEDAINEIIDEFDSGKQVVVFKGLMGSGKSVVALNVARHYGGGMFVVPTKALQEQYFADYGNKKMSIPNLNISFMLGRANFTCLLDNARNCGYNQLPCTRKLHKKETRRDVCAQECPHFAAIAFGSYEDDVNYGDSFPTSDNYIAINDDLRYINWGVDKICHYYKQYEAYVNSNLIVLNAWLWRAELNLKRLPHRPVIVIDEADSFLEALTLELTFTDRRLSKLEKEGAEVEDEEEAEEGKKNHKKEDIFQHYVDLENAYVTLKEQKGLLSMKYEPVKVFMSALIGYLRKVETDYTVNYLTKLKWLEEFESAVCYIDEEKVVHFFIPEPKVVWESILRKLGDVKILLMSGTMQNEAVLQGVYGIKDYGYIIGETKMKGKLIIKREPSCLFKVDWKSWQKEEFRQSYHRAVIRLILKSKAPKVVIVHAMKYLPDGVNNDGEEEIKEFREGKRDIVISTKIKRGIDFNNAKSLILLKYPFPDTQNVVLKVMKLSLGDKIFWKLYHDMAFRDFIQSVGRVLRHENQIVEFRSPDIMCYTMLRKVDVDKEDK